MKIFNIQQLFRGGNKRTAKWVSSLLFLFCLISFSNNVVAQQVVLDPLTVIPATIACAGGTTIITANATGPASIEYYIDGVLGTNPFTVSAGSHTVRAQEVSDPANYDEETINITETLLSASVSGDPYFCTAGSGEFIVSVSGGMTDYTVTVTGQTTQTGSGPDFTFSNLAAGTYPISVTDGCTTPATVTDEFIVEIDAAGPVVDAGTNNPEETDYASFVSGLSGLEVVTYGPAAAFDFSSNGENTNATSDLYNYSSATYSFTVSQTGATAAAGDVLRVSVSTDNGSTYGTPIEYFGPLSGLQTGTIPLSGDPNQNRQIKLKLEANISTPTLEYHITNYQINAIEKVNSSTFVTTAPTFTDAISDVANVKFTDGGVFWYSSVPGSEELTFNRHWEATDKCGKTTSVPQFIRVGAPPVINMTSNPNLTFGCANRTHAITAPTATDNASAAGDIVISWALDGVTFTNGDFPSHEFTAGETATITWKATDQAGFSSTAEQTVTINPYITISVTPLNANFCEENPASFTVTTSGGSSTYSSYNFLPTGSFVGTTFTTSGLTTSSPTITIECVDDTGCTTGPLPFSTANTTSSFIVHPKIVTNSISRSNP